MGSAQLVSEGTVGDVAAVVLGDLGSGRRPDDACRAGFDAADFATFGGHGKDVVFFLGAEVALQLGLDHAWVDGDGRDAVGPVPSGHVEREQGRGGLRLPVGGPFVRVPAGEVGVVEVDATQPVPARGQGDNTTGRCLEEVKKGRGQQVVTEVAHRELHLMALRAARSSAAPCTARVDRRVAHLHPDWSV
jgi:hypothetical protein